MSSVSIQTEAREGFPQIERPALYAIPWDNGAVVEGMFVNNGQASAVIVATIDYRHGQWAAYMAGVDGKLSEDEAILYCAAHGVKLPSDFGSKCFPMLPVELWRK